MCAINIDIIPIIARHMTSRRRHRQRQKKEEGRERGRREDRGTTTLQLLLLLLLLRLRRRLLLDWHLDVCELAFGRDPLLDVALALKKKQTHRVRT